MLYKIKEVDAARCNSCEKCVQVCHANCFDMAERDGDIIAEFIRPKDCDCCGDCIAICPVEGSAIALQPILPGKQGHIREIDEEKCISCGKCINLCPGKNIKIIESGGKVFAKIIDPKKCVADGHCTFCCPVDDKVYSGTD